LSGPRRLLSPSFTVLSFAFRSFVCLTSVPVELWSRSLLAIGSSGVSSLSSFAATYALFFVVNTRSEEHTSELQSRFDLVCRLLLEKKKKTTSSQRNEQ